MNSSSDLLVASKVELIYLFQVTEVNSWADKLFVLDVWVSVRVYGTFFRPGFGTLYLKTWALTVKPHLTTPFCLCLTCAFEQSSMLFMCLEPLGAYSQASLHIIKQSITVCQLLHKRNRLFFSFLPLVLHWKSILLTQPSHLFNDTY